MHARPAPQTGFTLIELLTAVVILAALCAFALPAFAGLFDAGASRSARHALAVAIGEARAAAITQGRFVSLCPSRDLQTCSGDGLWHHGWISFTDLDHDGTRNAGEPIVGVTQAQHRGVAIRSTSGRPHIRYMPSGMATGTNLTLTICDRRGASHAVTLVLNNAGRLRRGTPTPDQAASACAAVGT
ncbi:GspH/FimT family pseudopilin [Dokdonella sp. MW10]|uniref:GspH/FimT family pseudopilin n=1 Tax=Dokdonella sp. MW10 TaxID=2992926 RepID=UPI003F7F84CD